MKQAQRAVSSRPPSVTAGHSCRSKATASVSPCRQDPQMKLHNSHQFRVVYSTRIDALACIIEAREWEGEAVISP